MLHILLVDDDEDEHLFFQWSIEKIETGIHLSCVFSGSQAQVQLTKKIPDIIFLDINLPGADGFECLETIRKMPGLKNVPVFMYSTEITDTGMQKAIALGAAGCIKKSRSHDVLAKTIIEKLTLSKTDLRNNVVLK